MTKAQYVVSTLFATLLGASAVVVGQSVAAEAPKVAVEAPQDNCVTTFDYDNMSEQQRDTLFPD